jgi:hypothetical protein
VATLPTWPGRSPQSGPLQGHAQCAAAPRRRPESRPRPAGPGREGTARGGRRRWRRPGCGTAAPPPRGGPPAAPPPRRRTTAVRPAPPARPAAPPPPAAPSRQRTAPVARVSRRPPRCGPAPRPAARVARVRKASPATRPARGLPPRDGPTGRRPTPGGCAPRAGPQGRRRPTAARPGGQTPLGPRSRR